MSREEKLKLVEKLVNDKHISFKEGLALMETEKEYIYTQPYYPLTYPAPSYPWTSPVIYAADNTGTGSIGYGLTVTN